ncbi:gamma-glutamylcyclotransferase family protein [Oceanicoccus sp.]|uniref:gamma-glutamylcyclotransferase family protein n=1 Tax=Oceanicoccus sp. TaxID=2691044 RepID=UPI0034475BEC
MASIDLSPAKAFYKSCLCCIMLSLFFITLCKSVGCVIEYYFAYGSNMNPARMGARGLSTINALAGTLEGFSLRFDKRATGKTGVAYANVGYQRDGRVEGVLYQLERPEDIVIMDPFEGNPVRYGREAFCVNTAEGVVHAWVYVANKAMLAKGLLPERAYLNHLLAGKQWHSNTYHQWLSEHICIESDNADSELDGLIYNV